ncbi:hypothetical protein Calkr_1816 [Caldicellulosiruptor acetigenus I77R1B]|uniref:Peptidase MA-like domain-containing protein n=1 Tax=Caldicellulosiruptor acetigenus (strain ATCC 700853 / DSM 12137 / I77R1B) TaxID=632335 RepID=E4S435_CALA7|nr:hypothetical protein [Caldicellulosiruptor acetigenus]ADQ41302.1 hypothetical protein Calkr_1816 [Caldicellulosiruptor acetigenus I77R1B]
MKKSKAIKTSFILFTILIIAFGTTFIPTLQLKTKNMKVKIGRWVDVYYEKEEAAALDCFNLAEQRAKYFMDKLGIKEKTKIKIFIYDKQSTFQTKKYGLITLLFNIDWYIGDNIGSTVILTSPANPGRLHNYESIKQALPHEMVHAYEYLINPKMKEWLKEGIALYLTNGGQLKKGELQNVKIPSFEDIQTENPIKFANIGGYIFADTYIEYLDKKYGWHNVLQLLKTNSSKKTFGKTEKEIYEEWVNYIKKAY